MASTPAKKNVLSLTIGAADGSPELIQTQDRRAGAVKLVSRVQRIVAEILEYPAVDSVAAALRYDADLAPAAGAEFGGIVARVHAKLLHVLHAGLQPEDAVNLTTDVAGIVGDDTAGFDSVVPQRVLLEGAAVEAHVVEGTGSEVDRARRHHIELRNLPAVDGEFGDFPRADVAADRGGAGIDDSQCAAGDDHLRVDGGWLKRHVERPLLAHLQIDAGILRRRHTVGFGRDGIPGGRKLGDEVHTLLVGHNLVDAAGILVFHRDGGRGDHRARSVGNRTRNAAHVDLAMD